MITGERNPRSVGAVSATRNRKTEDLCRAKKKEKNERSVRAMRGASERSVREKKERSVGAMSGAREKK